MIDASATDQPFRRSAVVFCSTGGRRGRADEEILSDGAQKLPRCAIESSFPGHGRNVGPGANMEGIRRIYVDSKCLGPVEPVH
jgi:hypothetical protein